MKITKQLLGEDPNLEGSYIVKFLYKNKDLELSLNPDDVDLEETISLANKILSDIERYESKARNQIVKDFLDNYNENWSDAEEGYPILSEEQFKSNLSLNGIHFLGNTNIDFFYEENGMFGNHSLIANSNDGENFDSSSMFG